MPFKKLVLLFAGVLFTLLLQAQIPSLPANLGNVKAADVTEEQIGQAVEYMNQNNMTAQQAYSLLIRRGMNPSEAAQLRARLEKALTDNPNARKATDQNDRDDIGNTDNQDRLGRKDKDQQKSDSAQQTKAVANPKKIFGLEIFSNGVLTFEPNLRIATPVNYVLGPDDEVVISIYGYQEAKYTLRVGPDGDINVPYVGIMYVAGLTIEQATEKIKNKLAASGYSNIRTGLTKINVSVGRIRSIKVTVLGEVKKPGTYTLPSLATAFNALYLSGGPTDIGSMRQIQIIRNGKVVDNLDIYDFLVKGDQRSNINLRDQDVIRIPAYKVRVSLEGEVKRPGLFEMKTGETLQNLLDFAGGFSDSAYTASITGYKVTDVENKITDIAQSSFDKYQPSRSESFMVRKIVGRFINRVTISGAVYIPGDYELTQGMTIKDLIMKARGLKENAFNTRGIVTRSKADLTPEFVSFSPVGVLNGTAQDVLLRANDRVSITSVDDLKERTTVSVFGEVRDPGAYEFVENMSLKDLVMMAGGFTDAAIPQRIEVARRLRKGNFDIKDPQVSEVFEVTDINDLQLRGGEFMLMPYDAVVVRRNPGYREQTNVSVTGEVAFPGPYVVKTKSERISDLLKRAGGLTPQAYKEGGYLTRVNNRNALVNELNTSKINKIQQAMKDTTTQVEKEVSRNFDQIAIDLHQVINSPGSSNDLVLEEGDVLTIPKEKMDVRISGQVLFPTRVVYNNNMNMDDYLGRAGGLADNARKGKIYVLYPNGNAAKTSNFLFFRSYPKITPGSEVIVPKKHLIERRRLSTGEVIGIATAITSFAGVLLSLLINVQK